MKPTENRSTSVSFITGRTFSSLQSPTYRLYFLAMLGQYAAMNMQNIGTSLLTYRLTGSPALLGSMALANAIPMILLSMFGGAIADRMQKKVVIILGLTGSALINIGIAICLTTGVLSSGNSGSWWILLASAFVSGAILGLMMPARQAIIPEIVQKDHVMNAVALNMLGMNVLSLAAPGVAGFLINAFDFKSVFFTMAGLNLYAAIFVFFIPHTSRITRSGANILGDIQQGFLYIRRDKKILLILGFTLIITMLSMPYSQLLPIFVDDILKVGATGMGMLMSVSGAGALVGSLVMASSGSKKRGLILLIGGIISGIALIGFSFSSVWIVSLIFIVFVGLGQTIRGTISGALLQSYAEPAYMGRVMSIFMMQWGVVNLCTFIAGVMASIMPVQWVIGGLAMVLIILVGLGIAFVPRIRKLD